MSLAGCGIDTKKNLKNNSDTYIPVKRINLDKYNVSPVASPSFNTDNEILKSFDDLLKSNQECRTKLKALKQEVKDNEKFYESLSRGRNVK